MGKRIDTVTAEQVGKNFLESVKPLKESSSAAKQKIKINAKPARQLTLIHQAASLTVFNKRKKTQTRAKLLTLKKEEEPCFYIFNSSENEFVIVSADASTEPIIGYSAENSFNELNMPPAMVDYLESIRLEILQIRKEKIAASKKIASRWDGLKSVKQPLRNVAEVKVLISPLIKTKWSQRSPYNKFCPPGCPTGCIATAMAQVMNYYGFPLIGTGSHTSSESENGKNPTADFGNTVYRWNFMPQRLTLNSTESEINAGATLMRHCGISVDMEYTTSGSGAHMSDAKDALKKYFKYDKGISSYSGSENSKWIRTLKDELYAKRPVIYAGHGSGGHAFVCDGLDNKDFFHFNWGLDGGYDGYFLISSLYPGTNDYNSKNEFLYNIKPSEEMHFAHVFASHETNDNEQNPIIFPYGYVPVVKGIPRSFMVGKSSNKNYTVEHVTFNGKIIDTMSSDGKNKVTIPGGNKYSNDALIVQLRNNEDFTSYGITYSAISPDYKTVRTVSVPTTQTKVIIPEKLVRFNTVPREYPGMQTVFPIYYDVKEIHHKTFSDQKQLVAIRTGIGVKYIGQYAFSGCSKLQFIGINASTIWNCAFEKCTSLKKIISYQDNPPVCGKDVFKGLSRTVNGVSSLKHITLQVYGDKDKSAYRTARVWENFTIVYIPKHPEKYYLGMHMGNHGEYELHRASCTHKSKIPSRLINLGTFDYARDALLFASSGSRKVDGCYYCCPEEHLM